MQRNRNQQQQNIFVYLKLKFIKAFLINKKTTKIVFFFVCLNPRDRMEVNLEFLFLFFNKSQSFQMATDDVGTVNDCKNIFFT